MLSGVGGAGAGAAVCATEVKVIAKAKTTTGTMIEIEANIVFVRSSRTPTKPDASRWSRELAQLCSVGTTLAAPPFVIFEGWALRPIAQRALFSTGPYCPKMVYRCAGPRASQ